MERAEAQQGAKHETRPDTSQAAKGTKTNKGESIETQATLENLEG